MGNGGIHNGQVVSSTGVTGLTATLQAGTFANGNGSLTYTITGTPNIGGIASFAINIGGKTCTLTRTVASYITDVEGNTYKTVYIGTQQWMTENLKVSKYNDGTTIPNITDNTLWQNNTTGAWSYYNNDAANNAKHGKLYNWYVLSPTANGNKNVCPIGWHVPTSADWSVLIDYLGGASVAGGKMKEVGTTNWNSPNTGATNSSLFTGLPSGQRSGSGTYVNIGNYSFWWSSTEYIMFEESVASRAYSCFLNVSHDDAVVSGNDFNAALSVRCLKDESSNGTIHNGTIQNIDCGTATNNGTLLATKQTGGVTSIISYTGGNGGTHNGQVVTSTGVYGLTATLQAGTFANGNGSVTYTITGTPVVSGTASFVLNIGGKSCVLNRTVSMPVGFIRGTLDCDIATNYGTLTANTSASSVTSLISYTDGMFGTHNGQVVTSTGVTGLTATLQAGAFDYGNGTLNYTITGTPTTSGTASFALNIGGKTCILTRTVAIAQTSGINFTSIGDPVGSFQNNVSDIDGNTYKTVQIGTQVWMAENLKTAKYSDGTTIPNITDNAQWQNNTTGAWSYYNNDAANNAKYGKLYNWYAVSPTTNGNKNVCPTGWHVPTDAEWTVLTDYLGGAGVAAGKMKEVGTTNWISSNTDVTNISLFTGLPGGFRNYYGNYHSVGVYGNWWSSTEDNTSTAWYRYLSSHDGNAVRNTSFKDYGFSVRCLRD